MSKLWHLALGQHSDLIITIVIAIHGSDLVRMRLASSSVFITHGIRNFKISPLNRLLVINAVSDRPSQAPYSMVIRSDGDGRPCL